MSFGCRHAEKQYGGRTVVSDVTLNVNPGEIVGLLGPNGAGKTTTFSMLVGIEDPDQGGVYLDDNEITHLPLHKRARLGIGYLPQESSVFGKLSVRENLAMYLQQMGLPRREQRLQADQAMKEFGIYHLSDSAAHKLSGGERRRLEVCRALLLNPRYLLLDEPFAGIDPVAVEDLQKIVRSIRDRDIGVLITDHNVRETLKLVDRACIINKGEVFLEGSPEMIAGNEEARSIYLGEGFNL